MTDHEVEIAVVVDGHANAAVVVHEFFKGHLLPQKRSVNYIVSILIVVGKVLWVLPAFSYRVSFNIFLD